MSATESEQVLSIYRSGHVAHLVPGLSVYRTEPPDYVVVARDDTLEPLSRAYERIKWRVVPHVEVDKETGIERPVQRMVIGGRPAGSSVFELLRPNFEDQKFRPVPGVDVQDFEYREDIGVVVGVMGAGEFVVDPDTCLPVTQDYHHLRRGKDGRIWGSGGTVDEPARKIWPFNDDSNRDW